MFKKTPAHATKGKGYRKMTFFVSSICLPQFNTVNPLTSYIHWGYRNRKLAIAFAIGVMSHVIIDAVFHEKDIRLSPFSAQPVIGFGILDYPAFDFIAELAYGLFCWWYFKGSRALLWVIVIFNVIDLLLMFAHGDMLTTIAQHPYVLPSIILFQILITWYFFYRYATGKNVRIEEPLRDL